MEGSKVSLGVLVGAVVLTAGCAPAAQDATVHEVVTAKTSATSTGSAEVSMAAGFDYEDRRYHTSCAPVSPDAVDPDPLVDPAAVDADVAAIHQLEGVDVDVLLAVKMEQPCDLDPDAMWRSAFASQELEGAGPSERLNAAWCEVAVHPPDPAEGFDC